MGTIYGYQVRDYNIYSFAIAQICGGIILLYWFLQGIQNYRQRINYINIKQSILVAIIGLSTALLLKSFVFWLIACASIYYFSLKFNDQFISK